MHNPNELQMKAVIWILKYLKLTLDSNILFQKIRMMTLGVYTEADWARSTIDRRSTFD